MLSHPHLLLKWKTRDVKRDRGFYIVERVAPPERSLMVNDSDLSTMACALLERMYYCKVGNHFLPPPIPRTSIIFATLKPFRDRICKVLGRHSKRVSTEQFVLMCPPRKRPIYQKAEEDFHLYGVSKKHAHSVMFVKMEKVNPTKAPRCIQPRSPIYNLALGVYLKPIEHKVYKKIQVLFSSDVPVVFKGLNVGGMGAAMRCKWESFRKPVAIGLDATKFDMHVSVGMLKWEHSVYNHMFGNDSELAKLLGWQLNNVGRGFAHNGTLSYKVTGRRFSGDMNTALGNCLIMCAMIYCWAKTKGVKIQLANNGDDAVVFMEHEDMPLFSAGLHDWFLTLGFRMVVEKPVHTFEEIEFCQMHPVYDGSSYRMVRNFSSSREKDSICLLRLTKETDYYKWLGAVGECGLALTSGIPVLQSFYGSYCRKGIRSRMNDAVSMQSGMLFMSRGMEAKWEAVKEESRYSFFLAFGITPDEQRALEIYYDELELEFGKIETIDCIDEIESSPF